MNKLSFYKDQPNRYTIYLGCCYKVSERASSEAYTEYLRKQWDRVCNSLLDPIDWYWLRGNYDFETFLRNNYKEIKIDFN